MLTQVRCSYVLHVWVFLLHFLLLCSCVLFCFIKRIVIFVSYIFCFVTRRKTVPEKEMKKYVKCS
jgi:hypothetical protein